MWRNTILYHERDHIKCNSDVTYWTISNDNVFDGSGNDFESCVHSMISPIRFKIEMNDFLLSFFFILFIHIFDGRLTETYRSIIYTLIAWIYSINRKKKITCEKEPVLNRLYTEKWHGHLYVSSGKVESEREPPPRRTFVFF